MTDLEMAAAGTLRATASKRRDPMRAHITRADTARSGAATTADAAHRVAAEAWDALATRPGRRRDGNRSGRGCLDRDAAGLRAAGADGGAVQVADSATHTRHERARPDVPARSTPEGTILSRYPVWACGSRPRAR